MPHQGVLFETPVLTSSAVRDGFNYKFWVYILVSRTGTLYVGITGYFDRRISQHKMDSIEGFTSKHKIHRAVSLVRSDFRRVAPPLPPFLCVSKVFV